MRILIIGATGRIGGLAVERAIAPGHDVTVLVRVPDRYDAPGGVTVGRGDVRDAGAVWDAVAGMDAVVAAVGVRSNSQEDAWGLEQGMRTLVFTMTSRRVHRLVALSGAGVDVPGDRKPLDRGASRVVRLFARHVVGAKQREFEVFARSALTWTALRPPLVTDGAARGYRLSNVLRPGARVTRADVALIDQIGDSYFLRAAPFVLPCRELRPAASLSDLTRPWSASGEQAPRPKRTQPPWMVD